MHGKHPEHMHQLKKNISLITTALRRFKMWINVKVILTSFTKHPTNNPCLQWSSGGRVCDAGDGGFCVTEFFTQLYIHAVDPFRSAENLHRNITRSNTKSERKYERHLQIPANYTSVILSTSVYQVRYVRRWTRWTFSLVMLCVREPLLVARHLLLRRTQVHTTSFTWHWRLTNRVSAASTRVTGKQAESQHRPE
jgi:hypothetical protein